MRQPARDVTAPDLANLLLTIDSRTRRVVNHIHRAIATFWDLPDLGLAADEPVKAHDLDLAVHSWRDLVPRSPDHRAALLRLVLGRCGLSPEVHQELAEALGIGDPDVEDAFDLQYGISVADALASTAPAAPRRLAGPPSPVGARLSELERSFERVLLRAGEVLFRAGDSSDSLYVVVTGRVRVHGGDPGAETVAADLASGEVIGEIGLLTRDVRSATITAVRDSELYRLDAELVERHLFSDPAAMRRVMSMLAHRLAERPVGVAATSTVRSIVLVPAGGTGTEVAAHFGRVLGQFLANHCRTAVVGALTAEAALGAGAVEDSSALMEWLSEQEANHDLLVYLPAGSDAPWGGDRSLRRGPEPWDRMAIRQADIVLLVGSDGAGAELSEAERAVVSGETGARVRQELVLLHSRRDSWPAVSSSWLQPRRVQRVHHVVAESPTDLGRLVRFLLGQPVGLVLSGGAIRGFGHVGVLRALEEHAVPVDVICATSVGALIGGAFAMGWSVEELERRAVELFSVPRRRMLDLTVPVTSLIGSVSFNHALQRLFGTERIENLKIPLLCTISDLTAAELVVRDSGLLRQAVRASCSIPVILPPVVGPDGHLLVDGGILNNVPVLPLLERIDVGHVIVSHVSEPFYTANEPYDYVDSLPLWRMLRSRLHPRLRLVTPGIGQVLLRSMEVGPKSLEREQIARADVYVRPEFGPTARTDTSQLPGIVRVGYEAASDALSRWRPESVPFR